MSFDKIQFRSTTWEKWHKHKTYFHDVYHIKGQKQQAKLISNMTTIARKKKYSILEIGPGDGGLCKELLKKYNDCISSYTIVDDIKMLTFCKENLKAYKQIKYIPIEDIDTIKDIKFKLLISNNCLSEITYSYRSYIYDTFFENCREVFILDSIADSKQFTQSKEYFTDLISNLVKHFKTTTVTTGHKYNYEHQKTIYATK